MDEVVVRSSAFEFSTTAEPSKPNRVGRIKVSPRLFITIHAFAIGEIGRTYSIRSQVMTLEDTHVTAERNIRVIVLIIFKDHIVQETLEVKGLLGADHIEDCILLDKRECLT